MEDINDSEFSAIYESIEDSGSDGDEYVAVTQPYPYMCPDSKGMVSPPSTAAGATWEGPRSAQTRKPKLHRPLGASNTTHLLTGAPPPHINPLPLPRKRPSGGSKRKHVEPQQSIKYKKTGSEKSLPAKPVRPAKPGYLSSNNGSHPPRILPRVGPGYQSPPTSQAPPPPQRRDYPYQQLAGQQHGQYQHQQQTNAENETNEYDSIKETRRMIAARKEYQEMARARAQEPDTEDNLGGDDEGGMGMGVQMTALSRRSFHGSQVSSCEELVSSGGRQGQSRVVAILLSIAVVSLLIAVASLALSLYSITTISRLRMDCSHQCAANDTGLDVATVRAVDVATPTFSTNTTPLQAATVSPFSPQSRAKRGPE